jgi:hypothetical protein
MLDDIERRRFLVEPARKDAIPLPVRTLDIDLDEGPGELFGLPWRRRLTRPKPNGHVLPPRRLARMQRDIAHDPVAFVEDGEDRDALRHRRHSGLVRRGRGRRLLCCDLILLGAAVARGQRKRDHQRGGGQSHAYSGIHGS